MKFYHKTIILLCCFSLLLSCSKNNELPSTMEAQKDGNMILSKVLQITDVEDRKLAYSSLSDDERFAMWESKLENLIASKSFSQVQEARVLELKNHLSLEIFHNGDAKQVFKLVWFPKWVTESRKVLSDVEIYNIALSLNDSQTSGLNSFTTSSGSEVACHCAIGSNFTCPDYTITWPPSIGYGSCTKKANTVCTIYRGCGALLDTECDGNHCPKDG